MAMGETGRPNVERMIWRGMLLVAFLISLIATFVAISTNRSPATAIICLVICIAGLAVSAPGGK
jgi:CHASE2 domain-containing sensor protein